MSGSVPEANEYLSEGHVATLIAAELQHQQAENRFARVVLAEDITYDKKDPEAKCYSFRHFEAISGIGVQAGKPTAVFARPTTVFNEWGSIDGQIYLILKAYIHHLNESVGGQKGNDPYNFDLYLPLSNGSGSLTQNKNAGGHWNYVVIKFRGTDAGVLQQLQEKIRGEDVKQAGLQEQKSLSEDELRAILENDQTKLDYLQLMQTAHQERFNSISDRPHDKRAKEAEGKKLDKIKAAITALQEKEVESSEVGAKIRATDIDKLIEEALKDAKAREFASSSVQLKETAMTDEMRSLLKSLYDEITIEFTDPMHWGIDAGVWRRLSNIFPGRQCQGWEPKQTLPFSPYTVLWLAGVAILCFIAKALLATETLALLGGFWGMFIIAASIILIVELGVWWSSSPETPYLSKEDSKKYLNFQVDNYCLQQPNGYTCGDCIAKYMVLKAADQPQTYTGNIRAASLGILRQAADEAEQAIATPRGVPLPPASDTISAASLLPNTAPLTAVATSSSAEISLSSQPNSPLLQPKEH